MREKERGQGLAPVPNLLAFLSQLSDACHMPDKSHPSGHRCWLHLWTVLLGSSCKCYFCLQVIILGFLAATDNPIPVSPLCSQEADIDPIFMGLVLNTDSIPGCLTGDFESKSVFPKALGSDQVSTFLNAT